MARDVMPEALSPHDLKAWLRREAEALGFALVGVTGVDPPEGYARYLTWLAQGMHGAMTWMARPEALAARQDPKRLLPEAKSILVLAAVYWPPYALDPPASGLRGRVAAYAWGRDYHRVLRKRAGRLMRALQARLGRPIPHRIFVDSGPVLERDLAKRAGLGWIGRNTCLIHPRKGSFFFLVEVLLALELPPDPPFPTDLCGRCTRCIDACPTQALDLAKGLDARRCISYLTIELRGPIPEGLRRGMGSWVFGCDICQEVCPWNLRFAPRQGDPAFAPRAGQAYPDLRELLRMDPRAFRQRFQGTPLMRAKWTGLLRNAAVALGNLGDPRGIPALVWALRKAPPLVQEHAAWALGRIPNRAARRALRRALARKPVRIVRRRLQREVSARAPESRQ